MSLDSNQIFASLDRGYPILEKWASLLSGEKSRFSIRKSHDAVLLEVFNDSMESTIVKVRDISGEHLFSQAYDCCPLGSEIMKDYHIETVGEDIEGHYFQLSAEASLSIAHGRDLPSEGFKSFYGKCKLYQSNQAAS